MDIGWILVIITTIGAILRFIVLPEFRERRAWFWIEKAVYAIEQVTTENGKGTEKKDFVKSFIQDKLKLNLNDDELEVLIESVVFEMKKLKKEVSPR